jgi:CheY-like chemotaxis protein
METTTEPLFIIMVDDDDEDVYSMKRAFSALDASLRFESVSSGNGLFDLIGTNRQIEEGAVVDPDLILLDLNLPTISGIEILKELRAEPTPILVPVVILSTSDNEKDAVRSYRHGANAVFTKPATFAGTMRIAESITSFWQTPGIRRIGLMGMYSDT